MLTSAQVAAGFGFGFVAGVFIWAVAALFVLGREALKCAVIE